ncbi:MAG: inorganic phosphate transporter [Bacteroidales bacterium]|nr:inorganic phosphate transporter [Bacteroidales bacterium]
MFSLSSNQQLFLLGGLAIAVGIITYSKKVIETVGANIVELSAEAAMVIVLAQSVVLFIFSSTALSNLLIKTGLPPLPLVPVSSTQVIVGCVVGIGLYKGIRNINFKLLGQIALGWIITPLVSGLIAFFSLFFMKNIFNIETGYKISDIKPSDLPIVTPDENLSYIFRYLLLCILILGVIIIGYFILLERKKNRELRLSEEKFWKNLK